MAGRRRASPEAEGEAGGPGRGGPGRSTSFYTSRWQRARPEAEARQEGQAEEDQAGVTVFIQVDGSGPGRRRRRGRRASSRRARQEYTVFMAESMAGGPGRRRRARQKGQAEEGQAGVTVFIQVDGRRAAGQTGGRRARPEGQARGGPGRRAGPVRRRARQELQFLNKSRCQARQEAGQAGGPVCCLFFVVCSHSLTWITHFVISWSALLCLKPRQSK